MAQRYHDLQRLEPAQEQQIIGAFMHADFMTVLSAEKSAEKSATTPVQKVQAALIKDGIATYQFQARAYADSVYLMLVQHNAERSYYLYNVDKQTAQAKTLSAEETQVMKAHLK